MRLTKRASFFLPSFLAPCSEDDAWRYWLGLLCFALRCRQHLYVSCTCSSAFDTDRTCREQSTSFALFPPFPFHPLPQSTLAPHPPLTVCVHILPQQQVPNPTTHSLPPLHPVAVKTQKAKTRLRNPRRIYSFPLPDGRGEGRPLSVVPISRTGDICEFKGLGFVFSARLTLA